MVIFLPSIAIAFAFNKTQAAKVVMPSPALKLGKQGPLFLTTTLRHGLPGDTRQLTSSRLTLTSITGPSAMRQARRLPSGVTDSWRMLRLELRGATESGICAEGAWKVCGK